MRHNTVIAILLTAAFVIGAAVGFSAARRIYKPVGESKERIRIIYQTDTITRENPVYLTRRVTDTVCFAVRDTVRVRDTLYVGLPREVREYGDSTYRAAVSGISPRLDWIEVYARTVTVMRTVTQPSPRMGFGLAAGVGAVGTFDHPEPMLGYYAGLGLYYRF